MRRGPRGSAGHRRWRGVQQTRVHQDRQRDDSKNWHTGAVVHVRACHIVQRTVPIAACAAADAAASTGTRRCHAHAQSAIADGVHAMTARAGYSVRSVRASAHQRGFRTVRTEAEASPRTAPGQPRTAPGQPKDSPRTAQGQPQDSPRTAPRTATGQPGQAHLILINIKTCFFA